MEHHFEYDIDGNPISVEEASRLISDINARRIAADDVGEYWVSTVHVVVNHQFGDGPPLIFETAVFHPGRDGEIQDCWRTPTKHAALAMHDQVCTAIRTGELSHSDDSANRGMNRP